MGILTFTLVLAICVLPVAALIAALSRHRKVGAAEIKLLGRIGISETKLEPEGAVIVSGELWPALSSNGEHISARTHIRIVGFKEQLALVEICE